MAGVSVTDIIRGAEFAFEIYQTGWSQTASGQYEEFGNDIKSLSDNLDNIWRVVENAKTTWAQQSLRTTRNRGPISTKDWDLSSLQEIIGDYHKTLEDCKRLLEENREFRTGKSVAYNLEWNLILQPKVENLKRRLEAHNSKIMTLLKPLEMHLLCEIHHDLAERIDAVHRSVLHLQGLLIPDVSQAISDQGSTELKFLTVPPDLEKKFQTAAEHAHPEIAQAKLFPLQAGADAFMTHFENSTKRFVPGRFLNERTPTPNQYLNLLKCVWIMEQLQQSESLESCSKDSQWPGYITQLKEDLSIECQRFSAPSMQKLLIPDLGDLKSLEGYAIWAEENIAELISPHFETYTEEVLKLPLPSPSPTIARDMTVFKIDKSRYRLVEAIHDKDKTSGRREELKVEIDLKTVNLTPIYATPSSRPKAFELLIHSGSTSINPTFKELKHLFRLQHLLTGYKVYERYDQAMVKIQFVMSNQSSPIEEHGRIQLWLPKPFESSSSANSPEGSEVQSTAANAPSLGNLALQSLTLNGDSRRGSISPQNNTSSSSMNRRTPTGLASPRSNTTGSLTMAPSPSRPTIDVTGTPIVHQRSLKSSIYSKGGSIMTNNTTTSRRTASSVSTISTGTGKARLHEKPMKPLLVIFLKSRDNRARLATVAIEIDDRTVVKRERCKCRTANSRCPVSCIESFKGHLIAQRWNADQSLSSWNLAALGVEQRKSLPEQGWNNLARVSISFQSMEDRYKFAGGPCSCKPKMQHDLSRCVLDGHHGIFGEIKQISSQRLRNYHEERDRASGRNMILGSLPEDDTWDNA
jgi:hypothetical protein